MNNGNTSSSGTVTTAGIRHSGNTGGMSANSTGWFSVKGYGRNPSQAPWCDGTVLKVRKTASQENEGQNITAPSAYDLNIAHTHSLPASYIYGETDGESQTHTHSVTASGTISGDSETRPVNYTMKIWKRIA